jgi:hypothetical protein
MPCASANPASLVTETRSVSLYPLRLLGSEVFCVEVVGAGGRAAAGAAVAVGRRLVGGDAASPPTTRAPSGALCTVVRLGRGRLDRIDNQTVSAPLGEDLFVEHRIESGLVPHGLPIERIRPDGHASVWWSALCGHERQDLDGVRSKAVIGLCVGHAHDNAIFGFIHLGLVSPSGAIGRLRAQQVLRQ